jgi:competence protein ComEC
MLEKFLHQTPFVKFVIPLILGIVFKINFPGINYSYILPLAILFISILLFQVLRLAKNYIFNRLWSFLIFLLITIIGAQLVQIKQNKIYIFDNKEYSFIATVIENPEEKENSVKTLLKINAFKDSNNWKNPETKLLTYFQKDSNLIDLKMGDQIIVKAYINEIKHSGNPYTFNYKEYLKFKEIYYQTYIKVENFKLLKRNCGNCLISFTNNLRQKLLRIYKINKIKDDEFAVLSALTLGYKRDLTPELKESFSTSGAMHILAVSGLHVGIIFIILSKLLFFLERRKYGRIVQSTLIILILIFYAMLTGLSNSVIRATIMFVFICIGRMFTRQVNIYNTLSASAFMMLLYNPYSIMDVGFQLSYLAVISIVFFQPKIYSLLNLRYKLPDYIWQLVSVAIAAQIATFPLTIHYFNQFPVYFILSNILIIPFVSIIIYGALILFCFSFSTNISYIIAKGLQLITLVLNKNVKFIQDLPFSKIDSLIIDKYEILILSVTILCLSLFIISKRLKYVKYSLILLILIAGYNLTASHLNAKKTMFIVHNIPKQTAINLINQQHSILYTSFDINEENKNIEYNIAPLWNNLGIKKIDYKQTFSKENFYQIYSINNIRIINVNKADLLNYKSKQKVKSDYIILSNNVNLNLRCLKDYFQFNTIIFDSSNSFYKINKWKQECQKYDIKYYSILDKGAFIQYL